MVHERERQREVARRSAHEASRAPAPPPVEALLALQRSAGNQQAARMLQRAFWEKSGGNHVWHKEEPDASFERVLDAKGQPAWYRGWFDLRSKPVYRRTTPAPAADEILEPQAPAAEVPIEAEESHEAEEESGAAVLSPPKPKVRRERPEPVADEPVPLPKDDQQRLLEQVGPSCWMFVIEAMANTRGFNTRPLSAALYLYPTGAEAEPLERHELMDAITARLRLIKGRFDAHTPFYPSDRVRLIAGRACPMVGYEALRTFAIRLLAGLPHTSQGYAVGDIHARLDETVTLTAQLSAQIAAPSPNGMDEEGKLLGGAWTTFDHEIKDEHLVQTMESVLAGSGRVAMMGIRERFKPSAYEKDPRVIKDGKRFDFTQIPVDEIKEGGPHAVMLVGYDTGARTITYKDPNHGDLLIIVTFDHVRQMAKKWGKVEFYGMPDGNADKGIRSLLKPKR